MNDQNLISLAHKRADRTEVDRIRRGIRRPPEVVTKTVAARVADAGAVCRGCLGRIERGERIVVEEDLNCYSPNRFRRTHVACLPNNVDKEVTRFLKARQPRGDR